MKKHGLYIFMIAAMLASCTPTKMVKPLAKGEKAIGAHFGGPMIKFAGAPIPIPFTTVTGAYGVKDNLTVYGSLHTTSAMFGVAQVDLGVLREMYTSADSSFGITASPQVNIAVDGWEGNAKVWPIIDINVYWHYNKKENFAYTGITNWFELASTRAHGEDQPDFWLPAINLGHQLTRQKTDYFIETKYIAPFNRNDETVVDYLRPFGNRGAIGIYLGLRCKF